MKTKLYILLLVIAAGVADMFAEAVVLPGTLDVTNVSYRPEEMPDFEVEGAGGMPETYLDMSPHENVDDTLLYAEWDVTIQPIQYNVTVDVYNRNSWSIQFHLLNQVGDTVKNLRHKGSSGQRGLVDIGSWDLSDLSAGDYKLRVHSATAWSAMKLKNIIFNCEGSSGVCGAQGDNIRWELGCDGIFTLSGTGAMKEGDDDNWYSNRMAIKQVTVGSGITNLVSYAFREAENIEEVVFGEGLTSIGNSAFWGCSGIKRVTFPSTLETLEDQAFRSCAYIESIDLPASVKSIGTWAFAYCYLEVGSITSRATTPPTCGDGAFYEISRQTPLYVPAASVAAYKAADQWGEFTNIQAIQDAPQQEIVNPVQIGDLYYNLDADNLTAEVTYQEYLSSDNYNGLTSANIPSSVTYSDKTFSVTSIIDAAFMYCSSLTSITIPNSVTSIGSSAFESCSSLTSVTIPNSVTSIGNGVFPNCSSLTTIIVEAGNTIYDSRDNCNAIIETSTNTLIAGCPNTVIPNSVTSIGDYAFYKCKSLTSVTIPNSVTSIGVQAFYNCTGLTSVTIPNSVTSIGNAAFASCSNLTSITIPNSVTSIGQRAFLDCSGLTSITCQATSAPELGNNAFEEVDKSIPLYVPSGSIAAYQAATQWNEFTNIQAIPSSGGKPLFPGDPGTLTLNLELKAAVMDGEEIQGYEPTGGGGYAKGSSVTITAQEIPGYEFVQWSDEVTDKSRTIELNESMTLTAQYSHSMIEIPVAANKWTFICLPPLGDRQYTADMFTYDGLTDVQWGTYNGAKRAAGQSGWETPESFNALQGYIIFSTTAGTLRINAYEDDIRQGESGNTIHAGMIDYASSHAQNANWNFVGNPFSQGYSIAGFAAAGITSPITVWNGTAYTTYTPGIDSYILNPFEAFFIQKAENGAEGITFSEEYLEGNGGSGSSSSAIEGELSGAFSVAEGRQVHFSRGNLQYQASTDTWRFAENQYDTIGYFNVNISPTYDGWIDLPGWGTGNNPTLSSKDNDDYSTFVDWGTNAISNGGNEANLWRTLTEDEFVYLVETRANASTLYGLSTVNGITGMIILPDDWQDVVGISFTPGIGDYSRNPYSIEQWSKMESAGAVFLPAAGYRISTTMYDVGVGGSYWSATPNNTSAAYRFRFDSSGIEPQGNQGYRYCGRSVRLVR